MGPEMILADWPKVATKVAVIYKKRLIYIDADDYRDKGTQCIQLVVGDSVQTVTTQYPLQHPSPSHFSLFFKHIFNSIYTPETIVVMRGNGHTHYNLVDARAPPVPLGTKKRAAPTSSSTRGTRRKTTSRVSTCSYSSCCGAGGPLKPCSTVGCLGRSHPRCSGAASDWITTTPCQAHAPAARRMAAS